MEPVGERGPFPTGTRSPTLASLIPLLLQGPAQPNTGTNPEYPPQEVPQKSTEPGSFSSDFIEKQQHWGPCRQGHTPTWAPSLSSWELGSSPGPRGYFGTSWGLRTPHPHHGLTVQIQEQTPTVRSTTVSHPHTLTKPSLSCARGLQLLYPTSAKGEMDRSQGRRRLS